MEENFFSKISNRYSLKFKLTRYYENDSYPQMREIYCTVIQLWSEHFLSIPRNKYWTVLIADKLYTNWIHMCLVHPISHLQLLMSYSNTRFDFKFFVYGFKICQSAPWLSTVFSSLFLCCWCRVKLQWHIASLHVRNTYQTWLYESKTSLGDHSDS